MKFILGLYFLTIISVTFFSYLFIDPNLFYLHTLYSGYHLTHKTVTTAVFIALITLFYFCYYFFLKHQEKFSKNVKRIIFLASFILLLSYPAMLSYDIFNYIATAKVLYVYHENPYIIMPIDIQNEPLLSFMHAANKLALYGISWIGLSSLPTLLSFGNFLLFMFNFKLLIFMFYIATLRLLTRLTNNKSAIIFFGLNPLVLIETFVSGHNDIVMMFFALLSFYFLLVKKNKIWYVLFIFISILIKYATIFLIPLFIYIYFLEVKKIPLNKEKIFLIAFCSMMLIFLFSSIREEIYPWYAIWFLIFVPLVHKRIVQNIVIILSFSLLLRYVPYMFLGTHSGITPAIKTFVTFVPSLIYFFYLVKEKYG